MTGYTRLSTSEENQDNAAKRELRPELTDKGRAVLEDCARTAFAILLTAYLLAILLTFMGWVMALSMYVDAVKETKRACDYPVRADVVEQLPSRTYGRCDLVLAWRDARGAAHNTTLQAYAGCAPRRRATERAGGGQQGGEKEEGEEGGAPLPPQRFPEPTCYREGERDLRVSDVVRDPARLRSWRRTWTARLAAWSVLASPLVALAAVGTYLDYFHGSVRWTARD